MAYVIEFRPEMDLVRIRWSGGVTLDESTKLLKEILFFRRNQDRLKILLEFERHLLKMSVVDLYELGKKLAESDPMTIAYVCRNNHSDNRFFETVAQNHGANIKCFRNEKDARSWLNV